MNPQLEALLTLQDHDQDVAHAEGRVAALAPRLAALQSERAAAERAAVVARAEVEREQQRQRDVGERAAEYRRLNARAVAQMDQVRKVNEATAATAQVDVTRRALGEAETELAGIAQRLTALRRAADAAEFALAEIDERQTSARASIDAARTELEQVLAGARARRGEAAKKLDPPMLLRYDRARNRSRQKSVYPLRGASCSNCDTAVPTQRRAALLAGISIDVCESCGVLVYAAG